MSRWSFSPHPGCMSINDSTNAMQSMRFWLPECGLSDWSQNILELETQKTSSQKRMSFRGMTGKKQAIKNYRLRIKASRIVLECERGRPEYQCRVERVLPRWNPGEHSANQTDRERMDGEDVPGVPSCWKCHFRKRWGRDTGKRLTGTPALLHFRSSERGRKREIEQGIERMSKR